MANNVIGFPCASKEKKDIEYKNKRNEVDELIVKSDAAVAQLDLLVKNGAKPSSEQLMNAWDQMLNADKGLAELKSIRTGKEEKTCFEELVEGFEI